MAKGTNETKRLNIYPNLGQMAYFEQLRKKFTYGNSNPEVVLRLVDERIRQLLDEGKITEETNNIE